MWGTGDSAGSIHSKNSKTTTEPSVYFYDPLTGEECVIFSKGGRGVHAAKKGLFGLAAAGKAKLKTKAAGTQSESEQLPSSPPYAKHVFLSPALQGEGGGECLESFKNRKISKGTP